MSCFVILKINGEIFGTPYIKQGVSITIKDNKLVLEIPGVVKVMSDGRHAAWVCVDTDYQGVMMGMCGDMDQDRYNDFVTSEGHKVDDDQDGYDQIGDSWQVTDVEHPQ